MSSNKPVPISPPPVTPKNNDATNPRSQKEGTQHKKHPKTETTEHEANELSSPDTDTRNPQSEGAILQQEAQPPAQQEAARVEE